MQPVTPSADVGVIVGRFQVPDLTAGHLDLIFSVIARHQKVILFLGSKPGVLVTRKNPLDFATRAAMIQDSFIGLTILPIPDQPTDEGWSKDLDRRIKEVTESSCLLYGSRDGFAPAYSGVHPVVELEATIHVSGTEVRKAVSHRVRQSEDFRKGVIYAAFARHATSYQTVDMAVIRRDGDPRVLLGRKSQDPKGQYRFFGGFVNPSDDKLEHAASRELAEETGGIGVHANPKFIGSLRIDDWRYRDEDDGIMTAFFLYDYFSGAAVPSDDIDEVKWFPLATLHDNLFVEAHRPLLNLLQAYLKSND